MSPSAPSAVAPGAAVTVPVERLEDGEVVILAVKPSRLFVLLVSWPWLATAAVVGAGALAADWGLHMAVNLRLVALMCSAVACTRLTIACFQWQGRLYVLTTRRVMRFRGVFREEVRQCPLRRVAEVCPTASLPERLGGVGTLWFRTDETEGDIARAQLRWLHLAEPAEAQRVVQDALRRARSQ